MVDTVTGEVGITFKKAVDRGEAGRLPGIMSAFLWRTDLESLNGLVATLQQAGLGEKVASWLGSGRNLPVTAQQLHDALGDEHVEQLARQLGAPAGEALQLLSENLPCIVDRASPNGSLPAAGVARSAFQS
jgi:uncharacterized protein YidB (DUF937 family)